jgi:hypothetical protein
MNLNFRKSVTYFANLSKKLEMIDMNQAIGKFLDKFTTDKNFYRNISRILFGKFAEKYKLEQSTLDKIDNFLKQIIGDETNEFK